MKKEGNKFGNLMIACL